MSNNKIKQYYDFLDFLGDTPLAQVVEADKDHLFIPDKGWIKKSIADQWMEEDRKQRADWFNKNYSFYFDEDIDKMAEKITTQKICKTCGSERVVVNPENDAVCLCAACKSEQPLTYKITVK